MVAGVLSGNRNFEGRIHPQVRANYLASPMLVVVYGLAGRVDIDLETEPIGILMDAITLPDPLLLHYTCGRKYISSSCVSPQA